MNKVPFGSAALLAALWAFPSTAAHAAGPPAAPPKEEAEEEMVIEDEMDAEAPKGEQPKAEGGAELDALLGEEDTKSKTDAQVLGGDSGEVGTQDKDSAAKQIKTEMGLITVVQRQRFLKKKRFDLQPQIGISVNDPYVRHYAFGAEFNFWFHNRMAVGLNGTGFVGAKTPRYNNIRIQEGLLLTANKVLWQASLSFLYNPFYGKIAIFNRFLLHWEAYVQLAGGAIQTQVIPRFSSLHDPFNNITGQGNFAFGSRFYLPAPTNWISINFGVRHYMYPELLEPFNRGPTPGMPDTGALDDPADAKAAADKTLGQTTIVFLGVSFYLPSTFEYTTPR